MRLRRREVRGRRSCVAERFLSERNLLSCCCGQSLRRLNHHRCLFFFLFLLGWAQLHAAAQQGTILYADATADDVASEGAFAANINAIATLDVASDLAHN